MKPKLKLQSANMPNRQIICFIDPQKFSSLLGRDKVVKIGFYQNRSFLNNSRLLVYVDEGGCCKINSYDIAEASSAHIILVPDTFSFIYEPQCEFTVLYHGLTAREHKEHINRLSRLPNYRGSKESIEESSTLYSEIAGYLKEKEKSCDDFTFDSIWRTLSAEFLKSKIDNFCTKILMQYELDSIDLPDSLGEFTKEFNEFKETVGTSYETNNPEHNKAFIKLKGRLLRD